MIDIQAFNNSIDTYEVLESRTNYFTLARNLINSGFEIEGLLLILTTWNFAAFRYHTKTFDIDNFKKTLQNLEPHFKNLNEQIFETIILEDYKKDIQIIYNSLSSIKGISFTGSPKLMHLKNPNLFVMWDAYIRGEKSKKYYNQLSTYKDGTFEYKKYDKSFNGYFEFLSDMQKKYKYLNLNSNKSLAKSIDEFNYVNITLTIQTIEKQESERRKSKKNPA